MKILIILNGRCKNFAFLKELALKADKIICADGGYKHALSAGITPDIVVGDFDSSEKPDNVDTLVFPADKDLSDAEIALEYAANNYDGEIILTCALGGRLDHQLFNLYLFLKYNDILIEEDDVIISYCDDKADFNDFNGKCVSFLPLEDSNITLSGFKYPLKNADVKIGDTLTLSNVALAGASITVNSGKVLAIVSKTDI
ncbi:MAG: thiamine diphosphokinase [Clostridia bacterium]|nr:thiamine diphosphokinase [Clostridia bacterium]